MGYELSKPKLRAELETDLKRLLVRTTLSTPHSSLTPPLSSLSSLPLSPPSPPSPPSLSLLPLLPPSPSRVCEGTKSKEGNRGGVVYINNDPSLPPSLPPLRCSVRDYS